MSARTKRQRQARALRRRVERAEARVAVLEDAQRKSAVRTEIIIGGHVLSSPPLPESEHPAPGPLALMREYRSEIFGAVLPPLLVLLIFAIPLVVGIFLGWWAS